MTSCAAWRVRSTRISTTDYEYTSHLVAASCCFRYFTKELAFIKLHSGCVPCAWMAMALVKCVLVAIENYLSKAAPKSPSTSFGTCCPFYSSVGMAQGVSAATRNYRMPRFFLGFGCNTTSPNRSVRYVGLPRNWENDSDTCFSPQNGPCMDRLVVQNVYSRSSLVN